MFSMTVASVSNTKIFARSSLDGHQFLVYSMSYEANTDLAMILPLPTPPKPSEDAVHFIDLSDYSEFFEDIFVPFMTRSADPPSKSMSNLLVHDVGSFEASFVPQIPDFSRLDSRFQLDNDIWSELPQYDDYGFAVFKLKAGAKSVHPMAFKFPRQNPKQLFFPTVHVHDGNVEPMAKFHHVLYCQSTEERSEWNLSHNAARAFMDIDRTMGIVDPVLQVQMLPMLGIFENADVILEE
jgi:hypothetical protein